MREVYRLQKSGLYNVLGEHSLHLLVAIQYVGKEKLAFAYLEERMVLTLAKLKDESIKLYLGKAD